MAESTVHAVGADRPWREPTPFLRGLAWPAGEPPWPGACGDGPVAAYPRVRSDDRRVPVDTWLAGQIPAGVRLEFDGPGAELELELRCHEAAGPTAPGNHALDVHSPDGLHRRHTAALGTSTVRLDIPAGRSAAYLPKDLLCEVTRLRVLDGSISPAPEQPRWLAYGDSITEGWVASGPSRSWPAIVGRTLGLDLVNLGFAGAARGEIAIAAQMAQLPADLISLAFGTNCWMWTPTSLAQMTANLAAFLAVLREEQPKTPILVVSPIVRPDAETVPNRLGASLGGLRSAIEAVAEATAGVELLEGFGLVRPERLPDGIHPDDEGHVAIADAVVDRLAALRGAPAR